jgi:hypothetical protein
VAVPTAVAADGKFVTACIPPGALGDRDGLDVQLADPVSGVRSPAVRLPVVREERPHAAGAGSE